MATFTRWSAKLKHPRIIWKGTPRVQGAGSRAKLILGPVEPGRETYSVHLDLPEIWGMVMSMAALTLSRDLTPEEWATWVKLSKRVFTPKDPPG